jgi:hypothetical protein
MSQDSQGVNWTQAILTEAVSVIEQLFRKGKFQVVDQALTYLKVDSIPSEVLLGILTITYHAKEHLPSRSAFLAEAEPILVARLGPQRVNALLKYRQ